MPVDQQSRFTTKEQLCNTPNHFLVLRIYFQHVAEFDDGQSRCLQNSAEKAIVRNQFLFLSFSEL